MLNLEEGAEKESSQGSQDSWFSSWSGLSTTFSSPKKRELSNHEDKESKKWWSSFCSQKTKTESVFSSQSSTSSLQAITTQSLGLPPTQTCVDKDNSWDDNESKKDDKKEDEDEDDGKVEFFVKVGKHKKFKFF